MPRYHSSPPNAGLSVSSSLAGSMDKIASALGPVQAVLWGEMAMAVLGVPIVCEVSASLSRSHARLIPQHYMLVIHDANYHDATARLRTAGFQDCPWSYGALAPEFYKERSLEHINRAIIRGYSNLDQNSTRFFFPVDPSEEAQNTSTKIILLPSSYANMQVPHSKPDLEESIHYPDAPSLLTSFVQTLVREPSRGMWTSNLEMWAITYVYGELMVSDDALDSCEDDEAKSWFNENIRRFAGGIDGVTCTKRLGRGKNASD